MTEQHATEGIDDQESYRPLSLMAVAGLLLALFSALALVVPSLAYAPWVAVAVSWMAVRRIDANPALLAGRTLALAGVAIAALIGSTEVASRVVEHRTHTAAAHAAAERFLDALSRGDAAGALALTYSSGQTPSPPATHDEHAGHDHEGHDHSEHDHAAHDHDSEEHAAPASSSELDLFLANPIVAKLLGAAETAEAELVKFDPVQKFSSRELGLRALCRVGLPAEAGGETEFAIFFARASLVNGPTSPWRVVRVAEPE
ncbi:hypothetical protein Mal64_30940 [Pseudobythopirellula maris]|uniref:DUF4190 domain-containing protein n=1 Tax=Pseudobythopirellula maris TaxID=2527991 RepID=A0A5C5ZM90_9BACT|nr:hypothetical protein [Pseudobythopirellula maris]TWT87553.1 hypothetical protein Mal64_30940 [Pseudobythopirellula maris]